MAQLLTLLEVAHTQGKHPNTIRRALRTGRLKGLLTRDGWIVKPKSLQEYCEKQAQTEKAAKSEAGRKAAEARWSKLRESSMSSESAMLDTTEGSEGRL
jgi:hypothetical protein